MQNLLSASTDTFVRLIERCDLFAGATRSACYRWLGKTLGRRDATATSPETAARSLRPTRREACLAGARTMNDALVTFS